MKKIFLVIVVAMTAIAANAQKFALLDMEYILKNIPAYERANEQLNQVSKKWQAEVEAINTEAQTMYKNYQNEVAFLSNEQKKAKQDAIMKKEQEASELKRKYFGPEGELFKKRSSLMSPIQDEIYNVVRVTVVVVSTILPLPSSDSSITVSVLVSVREEISFICKKMSLTILPLVRLYSQVERVISLSPYSSHSLSTIALYCGR